MEHAVTVKARLDLVQIITKRESKSRMLFFLTKYNPCLHVYVRFYDCKN